MLKVGDKVRCIDQRFFSFPKVGGFYEIIRIDKAVYVGIGDVALKDREGFCTNCTYPQGMFVKVGKVGEEEMFQVGDRIEVIWVSYRWCWPKVGEKYEIVDISSFGVQLKRESDGSKSKVHYYIGDDIRVKLIKEATMFEIGDRVSWSGHTGTIVKIEDNGATTTLWDKDNAFNGKDTCRDLSLWKQFKKIGEVKMSKYQELKERIENVKGWDKEADDILRELNKNGKYMLCVFNCGDNSGKVCIYDRWAVNFAPWTRDTLFTTDFGSNQCDKLDAGKRALLYLLNNSDIKKDNEEKIKELEFHRDTFATQVRSLNLQIEELRR